MRNSARFLAWSLVWPLVWSLPAKRPGPDLVAALDYGTFAGAYSEAYNISYWRKIPFAAPPVGENRFRAPQPPLPMADDPYDSDQPFDMCPQRTVNGSEDCLYLGLYSRPWSEGQPLRPVVVVFYGGGFIQGSASFGLPPSAYPVLNVSSDSDLVFVYPNYRVNAFGLLAGRQVDADPKSDTNAGLLDQRAAIAWANRYAAHFGGDPDRVSIWGQSAGAGSVVAHVIADQGYAGTTTTDSSSASSGNSSTSAHFVGALASSPFWPKTYTATSPEAQQIYDALANGTGCADSADSLACLKRADVQAIRDTSLPIADSHTYTTSSFTWAPVIDGKFLPRPLSSFTGELKRSNVDFAFGMYNTHEGENFVPGNVGSSFDSWLAGYLPGLSERDLGRLRALYPETGSTETLSSYSGNRTRAGLIFRDSVLACPAYWMGGAARKERWLGEYTIDPAKHGSDTYWWNRVNTAQKTDPLHYHGYTGAFASFFATGDPNKQKLTAADVAGVPSLDGGQEFVIDARGFANVELKQLKKRCDFWADVAPTVPV